jgi:tripartite-type tricarboxylate transporter receptor subunit TctC
MKASVRKAATPRRRAAPRGDERRLATRHPRRRILSLALGAAALPAASRMVWAQTYPSRPITMVVPYPAGGSTDVVARMLSEHMRGTLGQPIIVENVGGASGSIGVGRVARARPDGYAIILGNSVTHVLNGAVYPVQYDGIKDFEPIALLATNHLLIVGRRTMPANTLQELVAWLKANPDRPSWAHLGSGSLAHIAGVIFQRETGTRFGFVPYRGNAPAMQDLISGQIDLMFPLAGEGLPQVRSGNIKAFMVAAKSRIEAAPEIPTADEAGVPGFYFSLWQALFAPKGMPRDIINKLHSAVSAALSDATVRRRFADIGYQIFPRDQQMPDALAALQRAEIEKWWPIIKAANIKGE